MKPIGAGQEARGEYERIGGNVGQSRLEVSDCHPGISIRKALVRSRSRNKIDWGACSRV